MEQLAAIVASHHTASGEEDVMVTMTFVISERRPRRQDEVRSEKEDRDSAADKTCLVS
jgi:hypothetical protein